MPTGPDALTPEALEFLTERQLASYSSLRRNGTVHVTACGFSWDPEANIVRLITSGSGQKARNASVDGGVSAAVTQVDGPRWLTLEGTAVVNADPDAVRDAEARYAARYRQPRENPDRVVIELTVTRVLGSRALVTRDA